MVATGVHRRHKRRLAAGVALVAVSTLIAGCVPAAPGRTMGPGHMESMMGAPSGPDQPSDPLDDARDIPVAAGEMWFEPDVITVAIDEQVNFVVTNRGQIFHNFVIEELGLRIDVDAGRTVAGGLLVDQPGNYQFVCTVPGHAAGGMQGTLIVE